MYNFFYPEQKKRHSQGWLLASMFWGFLSVLAPCDHHTPFYKYNNVTEEQGGFLKGKEGGEEHAERYLFINIFTSSGNLASLAYLLRS